MEHDKIWSIALHLYLLQTEPHQACLITLVTQACKPRCAFSPEPAVPPQIIPQIVNAQSGHLPLIIITHPSCFWLIFSITYLHALILTIGEFKVVHGSFGVKYL